MEELDHALAYVRIQGLADIGIRHGVEAAGDDHMAIGVHRDRFDLAQRERLLGQRQQGRLFVGTKQQQGWLMGRAMLTCAGAFLHPGLEALVGRLDVGKLLAGHEVALDVVDAVLDLTLVLWRIRPRGTDHEPVVLRHAAVGFAQHGVMHQRLQHGGLQVVDDDTPGHASEALEGVPMQGNPGWKLLVEDQLGILMPAV